MKAIKLTDKNLQTYQGFQWKVGEWVETSGKGQLCGSGWIHFYDDELLAILFNPIHADIPTSDILMWRGEAKGEIKTDHGLKFGCTRFRLVRQIPVPVITTEQKVKIGILCARTAYQDLLFMAWADEWLSSKDRSFETARKMSEKEKKKSEHHSYFLSETTPVKCVHSCQPFLNITFTSKEAAAYYAEKAAAYYANEAFDMSLAVALAARAVAYSVKATTVDQLDLPSLVRKAME